VGCHQLPRVAPTYLPASPTHVTVQVIMLALSTDGGHSWQPPVVVPTELADAARAYPTWSPVLHWDEPRDRLLLFFTQSQSW
jgi:hypothetical protein